MRKRSFLSSRKGPGWEYQVNLSRAPTLTAPRCMHLATPFACSSGTILAVNPLQIIHLLASLLPDELKRAELLSVLPAGEATPLIPYELIHSLAGLPRS